MSSSLSLLSKTLKYAFKILARISGSKQPYFKLACYCENILVGCLSPGFCFSFLICLPFLEKKNKSIKRLGFDINDLAMLLYYRFFSLLSYLHCIQNGFNHL